MNEKLEQMLRSEMNRAKSLHDQHAEAMGLDPELRALLARYRDAIRKTAESMQGLGIQAACSSCAKDGRGSCCFSGIEEGYDWALLLANLLFGRTLPDIQEIPGSCFFVGEKGCKLLGRYYFCLHYLCPGIQDSMAPSQSRALCRAVGEELSAGWEVERAIRQWIDLYDTNSNEEVESVDAP